MAEKSTRRPQTPQKTGPNTIRRDMDEDERELLMRYRDQQLRDSLRPEDVQSKGKSAKRDKSRERSQTPKKGLAGPHAIIIDKDTEDAVRRIHDQEYGDQPRPKGSKRIFGSTAKSPNRPRTPKLERDGPHAIKVDKSVEKAVQKIYEREYPGQPLPQDLQSKRTKSKPSPDRPQTPKTKLSGGPNAIILDKNTEEVVRKHLEANDPFYSHEQPSGEVGGAKPKKGQVSPKSPQPQPSAMFPTEDTAETTKETKEIKKSDPKHTVQEALLTAGTVATVAFPAANTAEPRIVEEPRHKGPIGKLFRTFSGHFQRKKPKEKSQEPDSELSTTDTSVHTSLFSTSLPSELFEDRLSETYTPSTETPELDMTPARLARLSEEGDSLSDSFPSEVEEGAVGGQEIETFIEPVHKPPVDEKGPPGSARGRFRQFKGDKEKMETIPETENKKPYKRYNYIAYCQELQPLDETIRQFDPSSPGYGKSKTFSSSEDSGYKDAQISDDYYYQSYDERFPQQIVGERKGGSGRGGQGPSSRDRASIQRMWMPVPDWSLVAPYDDEPFPWMYEEKYYRRRPAPERQTEKEGKGGGEAAGEVVKKGVLQTSEGDFEVDYVKKPNNEVVVLKSVPIPASRMEVKSPRGAKGHLTPREELLRQKLSDKPRFQPVIREAEIDRSSSSDSESESESPSRSSSQRAVAGSSTGASWAEHSYSRSCSSSDASGDSDSEED